MSADCFVAYIGLRFVIPSHEVEAVELRTDARVVAARKFGLDCYWGKFIEAGDASLLLVGTEVGIFGAANLGEIDLTSEALEHVWNRRGSSSRPPASLARRSCIFSTRRAFDVAQFRFTFLDRSRL